jgi:prepilin-type processing-associated H-X9-DG protein
MHAKRISGSHKIRRTARGFALKELVATVIVLALLALVMFTVAGNYKTRSQRLRCVGNLKKIGVAMRGFAIDVQGTATNAAADVITNSSVALGPNQKAQINEVVGCFQSISNELNTPAVLVCPADATRTPAANFGSGFSTPNISYFLGIDVSAGFPDELRAGDRQLKINGAPAPSGIVAIQNTNILTWNVHQGGNVMFLDGSVQAIMSFGPTRVPRVMRLAFP